MRHSTDLLSAGHPSEHDRQEEEMTGDETTTCKKAATISHLSLSSLETASARRQLTAG